MSNGFSILPARRPVGEMPATAHNRIVSEVEQAEADIARGMCPNLCGPLNRNACKRCGFAIEQVTTSEPQDFGVVGFNRRWIPKRRYLQKD
jgi:hypothetical protein